MLFPVSKQETLYNELFPQVKQFLKSMNSINLLGALISSLNGYRHNQIMKVLTIVTVIFVPLTLLVGIVGMNFENMPELKSMHGYYILLSVMSGIAFAMLYLFRRVRWL